MIERAHPIAQEAKEPSRRVFKFAPGIPPIVPTVLSATRRLATDTLLTQEELAVMQEYYLREYLGKGKFTPNFSLTVDIEDEVKRKTFKDILEGAMNKLLHSIPLLVKIDRPKQDDATWYLKKVDTDPNSIAMKRRWKYNEIYRERQKAPKPETTKLKIKETERKNWEENTEFRERRIKQIREQAHDPEYLRKLSEGIRRDFQTSDRREHVREGIIRKYEEDPEYATRVSLGLKRHYQDHPTSERIGKGSKKPKAQ